MAGTLLRVERRAAVASGSPAYNPFENPAVPLASVGLDSVFGRRPGDEPADITPELAVGLPTVFRCVSLLSTVIASCPVNVWKRTTKKPIPHPLLGCNDNPEMTYTQYELWELVVTYLALWGNAYIFKKRDAYDSIIDLKPIYPGLVEPRIDRDTGDKIFLIHRVAADGTIDKSDPPQVFTDFEVLHIPGMGYDGLVGLSPIGVAARAVQIAYNSDKLASRFYTHGTQLGGIIKVKAPLTSQAQAEGIKARWMSRNAGVAHAGDVAILDAETDFQNITIDPDAMQFLESRRWQTNEIARLFGIPPHLVGDVEKSTSWGTGIEQQNIGFVAYTIAGWTNRIEQRITREVVNVRGQYAEFDLNRLMRGSTNERFQAYQQAVGGPWMLINEARAAENMQPVEGGNKLLPPQGIGPASPEQEPDGEQDAPSQDDDTAQSSGQPAGQQ